MRASASPLHQQILPALREAIVRRELPPGSRLAEVSLAQQFGVSRTPVRQALAQLEREGLVVILPRAGAFVRGITKKDVDEIYELRAAVESLAARLAAVRLDSVARARLSDVVEQLETSVMDGVDAYAEAIDNFHLLVMELSGNSRLEAVYVQLMPSIRRLRRLTLTRSGRPTESLRQHLAIARRLLAGDPGAGDLMYDHLEDARQLVKELADPQSDDVHHQDVRLSRGL